MNGKAGVIREHVAAKHSMGGDGSMKMNGGKTPAGASRKTSPAGRNFAPGGAVDGTSTQGAVSELYRQHPHNWNDLGPFHGGTENVVHEPHPYDGKVPPTPTSHGR